MIKQEINSIIREAREIHSKWLSFGKILVDGVNLDRVEEPINCFDCEFTHSLKTISDVFCEFTWYQELQESHEDLHKSFSELYYESHRMYNPKTHEELANLYVTFEAQSTSFSEKLDEVEKIFQMMSEDEYKNIINNKKQSETNESEQSPVEVMAEPVEMKIIDIKDHDEELTDIEQEETEAKAKLEDEAQFVNSDENSSNLALGPVEEIKIQEPGSSHSFSASKSQHIKLKEQDIEQLKQEKELSQFELNHLEERQKLTQQAVEQLEQYYVLKQQEIEAEKLDNDKLLEFKTKARKQSKDQFTDIEVKKVGLRKVIQDLTNQNEQDDIEQQDDEKTLTIKKQFDELKQNKTLELEGLEQHLESKEQDLEEFREKLNLLEQEVAEIKQNISKKENDLEDIYEKEQIKNEEQKIQADELEKITQHRLESINERQKELDVLLEQTQSKQNELEVIDFQLEDLNKNLILQVKSNKEELLALTQQQDEKRKKLEETKELKNSKQQEIAEIDERIIKAEQLLSHLKTESQDEEKELSTAT